MLNREWFVHPDDAAALKALEAVPGFPLLTKKIMEYGIEEFYRGINTASDIKLSERQLPRIYHKLVRITNRLGMETPDLFLKMDPQPNACTLGDTRPFIEVTSGLIEAATEEEVDAVLAHECGHILCRHVLYSTMAQYVLSGLDLLGVLGNLMIPLKLALLYWYRMSELSSDRVAAIATSSKATIGMLARISGGPYSITKEIDYGVWADQADEYEQIKRKGLFSKAMQAAATMQLDHPFSAVRVREILMWCATQDYWVIKDRLGLLRGTGISLSNLHFCPHCHRLVQDNWQSCMYCGSRGI